MDLTKNFPRSTYDMNAGIAMLPRTTDKARAHNEGKLGEYHYNCPLDKQVLEFYGIDSETFARKVKELKTDEKIAEWLNKSYPKSQAEKDKFNNMMRHSKPHDEKGRSYFESEKKRLGRSDFSTWFDYLDADEKRF